MSETKFTNGPWFISDELRTSINTAPTEDGSYKHIAMVNWCKYREYSIEGEEHDANAHLIAAAPEMYEALERIYGRLLMSERDGDAHITEEDGAMVEAALRKARGEA